MKIHLVKAELFLVDRQTDMMKLIAVFHNFANVPKNYTETVKPILINCCVMSNQMRSCYPEDTV